MFRVCRKDRVLQYSHRICLENILYSSIQNSKHQRVEQVMWKTPATGWDVEIIDESLSWSRVSIISVAFPSKSTQIELQMIKSNPEANPNIPELTRAKAATACSPADVATSLHRSCNSEASWTLQCSGNLGVFYHSLCFRVEPCVIVSEWQWQPLKWLQWIIQHQPLRY